jgi:hypothetical protein
LSQFHWSYYSTTGQPYIVGLYHGPESGHVVVYCNNEVIAIDFGVKESGLYSFFIEEDLCEIRIQRKRGKFKYSFESNQKVDTPFNRMRRKWLRLHKMQRIFAAVVVTLFAIGMAVTMLNQWQRNRHTEDNSVLYQGYRTSARLRVEPDAEGKQYAVFSYAAEGRVREGRVLLPADLVTGNGLPLENGDGFAVYYLPHRPKVYAVQWNEPVPELLDQYRQRVLQRLTTLQPGLSGAAAECLLDVTYEIAGLSGWADLWWQQAPPEQNARHNSRTHAELMDGYRLKKLLEERCRE